MTCIRDSLDLIDVAIIGSGPAGLAAALYTGRAGLKTVIFGDPYQSQLAKAGIIENFLTYSEPLQGLELIEKMITHATQWGVKLYDEEIRQIIRNGDIFNLVTASGDMFCVYSVILAMGTKYKRLGVKGEEEFYGKGVSYCTLCDGPLYKDQLVAVVGYGNEAAAAALRMSTIADSVDLIASRPRLGADQLLQDRLDKAENIRQFTNVEFREIGGDSNGVTYVSFQPRMREPIDRAVNAVFIEVGTMPVTAIAADLGTELEGQFIKVHGLQETSVPGAFAAGDLTGGKARQAAIAVGDGTRAAIGAIDYIKALGLSASKSKLQSVQWGATGRVLPQLETRVSDQSTILDEYIRKDKDFLRVFEAYHPDTALIQRIRERMPQAQMVIVSATWCPDCRRNVPRMARIAHELPDWQFEIYPREDEERTKMLDIRAIPTLFVIQDGREIGRIVENPAFGSLEADLWEIVSKA